LLFSGEASVQCRAAYKSAKKKMDFLLVLATVREHLAQTYKSAKKKWNQYRRKLAAEHCQRARAVSPANPYLNKSFF